MHLAKGYADFHLKCPIPWDCGCACPACLRDRANYIERQQLNAVIDANKLRKLRERVDKAEKKESQNG